MISTSIKVSIITPVYNSGAHLVAFVDSVLCQSMSEFELILVDDGSTDNSARIIQSYISRDRRVKLLHQQHSGAGAARNLGMSVAKGRYLIFLDSDDIIEKSLLELMYGAAIADKSEVVICGYAKFDNITNRKECVYNSEPGVFYGNELVPTLFQRTNPAPWNKLISLELIEREDIKFQNLKSCNDIYFIFSILLSAQKITFLKDCLLNYRTNVTSNITSIRGEHAVNLVFALNKVREKLLLQNKYQLYRKTFLTAVASSSLYEMRHISKNQIRLKFGVILFKTFGIKIVFYLLSSLLKKIILVSARSVKV